MKKAIGCVHLKSVYLLFNNATKKPSEIISFNILILSDSTIKVSL